MLLKLDLRSWKWNRSRSHFSISQSFAKDIKQTFTIHYFLGRFSSKYWKFNPLLIAKCQEILLNFWTQSAKELEGIFREIFTLTLNRIVSYKHIHGLKFIYMGRLTSSQDYLQEIFEGIFTIIGKVDDIEIKTSIRHQGLSKFELKLTRI